MVTFFEGFGFTEHGVVVLYFIVYIIAAIALSVGFMTRTSAIICLVLYVAITSGPYKYGVDVFITTTLFYLTLFPSGCIKSIDNLIFKNRNRIINFTPYYRVIQLNLCLIYLFAGISKAMSESWFNGAAVWKTINFAEANQLLGVNFDFLARNPILLSIMGISILFFEISYSFLICHKKTTSVILIGIILMHIGIALILNLYFFAAFMIILNLAGFYIERVQLIKST